MLAAGAADDASVRQARLASAEIALDLHAGRAARHLSRAFAIVMAFMVDDPSW
ncbi:MAG: hypothetical protein M5U07_20305 [Xanthobacteraceae bacterium]|nr:hypothetical protein [Xanthobacteraceae bacterium]